MGEKHYKSQLLDFYSFGGVYQLLLRSRGGRVARSRATLKRSVRPQNSVF